MLTMKTEDFELQQMNLSKSPLNRERGLTLIELMITLLILSIVTVAAVPAFSSLIDRNRITSITNQIIGALNLGRVRSC